MTIYISYLIITGILYWYSDKKGILHTAKGKMHYLIFCCVGLILLAALRGYSIGADTRVYLNALEYYSSLPKKEILSAELVKPFVFEKGYFFLTKICAYLGISKTVFLLIVAALIYIPVFISIYHYSKIPYISILAYFAMGFFSYSLGIFRQMIAISIILCGVKYITQKNIFKYAFCVAIAALFHTTAVASILIYVIYHIPIKGLLKFILPIEIICLVFGRDISLFLVKMFPRYSNYVGSQYDVQSGTYLMLFLLNFLLFFSIYLHYRGYHENRLTIAALSVAVMVQAVGYSMALLGRAVGYFSYFSIFAFSDIAYVMTNERFFAWLMKHDLCGICRILKKMESKYQIKMRHIVIFLFILVLGVLVLKDMMGNEYILPYRFFFVE